MDLINHRLLAQVAHPVGTLTGPGVTPTGDGTWEASKIISNIVGVLTIFAVVWFAVQIIMAGYAFITTEGDEKKMEMARKRITEGVIGLTIVIVSLGLAALIAKIAGIPDVFDLETIFSKFTY